MVKIVFIGDIFGRPGRRAVREILPRLIDRYAPDVVIANGENAASGLGLTPQTARELLDSGVNLLTSGNHIWNKKEFLEALDSEPWILRPLNYPPGTPGRGWCKYRTRSGMEICVINAAGRVFMAPLDCPFRAVEDVLREVRREEVPILVDFHAEATSEKVAMGWFLDGRVSAVVGTHTHVQTADETILPGGTAYLTDAGMTGPIDSVIGVKKDIIIEKFLTQLPRKFDVASGRARLEGCMITVDEATGRAVSIERIRELTSE